MLELHCHQLLYRSFSLTINSLFQTRGLWLNVNNLNKKSKHGVFLWFDLSRLAFLSFLNSYKKCFLVVRVKRRDMSFHIIFTSKPRLTFLLSFLNSYKKCFLVVRVKRRDMSFHIIFTSKPRLCVLDAVFLARVQTLNMGY